MFKIFRICFSTVMQNFVPKHHPVLSSDIRLIENFIQQSKQLLVLTGAGVSTESGIPDYRSEGVGLFARTNHKPIQYLQFVRSEEVRRRYWARNYIGWKRFSSCQPNATHESIKNLETLYNKITAVITQNVDSLHLKAGSQRVIELHGSAYRIMCLSCDNTLSRHDLQEILKVLNPSVSDTTTMIRPDGDVEISAESVKNFNVPSCEKCGGVLKPDIVFFGDNVPRQRVKEIETCVSNSDSLLILGSSLSVYSGYRIVLQAVEEKKKLALINIGPTRADSLINIKVSAKCGDILPKVCYQTNK